MDGEMIGIGIGMRFNKEQREEYIDTAQQYASTDTLVISTALLVILIVLNYKY